MNSTAKQEVIKADGATRQKPADEVTSVAGVSMVLTLVLTTR